MIDEKQVIKDIEDLKRSPWFRSGIGEISPDFAMRIRKDALETVEYLCIKKQPKANKWIPVSERLPDAKEYCKNDGRFIVTDGNKVKQGLFDIYADGYNDPYWPYQSCQPIAWMPLPEPYRAED